jgi:hypothetical protein
MSSDMLPAAAFLTTLIRDNGYLAPKLLPEGRYACLARFLHTTAIITGRVGDLVSMDDRWCYHDESAARRALLAWDGTGEPTGWHRHPGTGRRVAESAGEMDVHGNEVPIGTLYVRP